MHVQKYVFSIERPHKDRREGLKLIVQFEYSEIMLVCVSNLFHFFFISCHLTQPESFDS